MESVMKALKTNDTYKLTALPKGKTLVGSRWVYIINNNKNADEHCKTCF